MSDDDDDLDRLLGPEPGSEPEPKPVTTKPGRQDGSVIQALHRPVSITFLSEVMSMDRKTVTRRLSGLEPISQHRGNVPLYDFRQAMKYLVQPRIDAKKIEETIRKMSASELPPGLSKDIWDAKLKSQKWMLNAGELWKTEDVLEVLGDAFQRLKTTTQLWIDQVADNHALPEKARQELVGLVDGLQNELHMALVEMPKERQTLPQAGDLEDDD